MWSVLVGAILLLLKLADVAPVADWSWWLVLSPFGVAALWWAYADSTGLTRKRQMDKLDERRDARRRQAFEALGIDPRLAGRNRAKSEAFKRAHDEKVAKVEAARTASPQRDEDTLARSSTQFSNEFQSPQAPDDDPRKRASASRG